MSTSPHTSFQEWHQERIIIRGLIEQIVDKYYHRLHKLSSCSEFIKKKMLEEHGYNIHINNYLGWLEEALTVARVKNGTQ